MISVLGAEKLSLVEIEAFLAASESVRFAGCGRTEIYGWVERLLCHHEYPLHGRHSKGLLRAYLERMTGLSRAQSTRLIGGYVGLGRVAAKPSGRPRYQRHYTPADIELLASVDEAHETLSGPVTRHILQREFEVYGKPELVRLDKLSNGHLYNLRRTPHYGLRSHYEKTRPTAVSIGERRKPAPNGQPGFLRIDTVHQGDGPEGKGIYHINAVDEVTQRQVAGSTPRISEAYLEPLLENMLRQFPFRILGFHTDDGAAQIALVGNQLFDALDVDLGVVWTRLGLAHCQLCNRHTGLHQRRIQRGRVALAGGLQSNCHHRAGVQIDQPPGARNRRVIGRVFVQRDAHKAP